jgi:hypothetical protein
MARGRVDTYVIVQVAPVGPIDCARHPLIGLAPSRNSTVPVGSRGPGRAAGGETCAMNVVGSPATLVFGTYSEVTVESRLTDRTSTGLDDPATAEPGLGAKTALNCAAEAPNVVWQTIVTVWPVGLTGMPLQPAIGVPPLRKASVPDGPTEPGPAVTVPARVTVWLVSDGCGETVIAVVLVVVTTPTGAELALFGPPVESVADSTTRMKLPTSPGPSVWDEPIDVGAPSAVQLVVVLSGQSSHWTDTVELPTTSHFPGVSVSVWPSRGVPAMLGDEVFVGPGSACAPVARTNAPMLAISASSAALVKCRNRRKATSKGPWRPRG